MYDKSLAGTRQQKKNNTGPGIFAGPGAGGGALFAFDSWQCTKSHFLQQIARKVEKCDKNQKFVK